MEKKTAREILLQIYNETLESVWTQKVNLAVYEDLPDDQNIVPQELIEIGARQQKTVGERKKEITEAIETKEKQLLIINKMLDEEANMGDRDTKS